MALSSLESPIVQCPSPAVIYRIGSAGAECPVQPFMTPRSLKTPLVKTPETVEEALKDCIGRATQFYMELQGQVHMLDQMIEDIEDGAKTQIRSRPTVIYTQKELAEQGIARSALLDSPSISAEKSHEQSVQQAFQCDQMLQSVSQVDGSLMFCERDSISNVMVASSEMLGSIVDASVDKQMDDMMRSISSQLQMEATIRRLEQSLLIMQNQQRSIWFK